MTASREELARLLERVRPEQLTSSRRAAPASYQQERLWFIHSNLEHQQSSYNIPLSLRVRGPFDLHAWERALQRIVDRHEVLRTQIQEPQGDQKRPRQIILPAMKAAIHVCKAERADVETKLRELSRHVFDLTSAPLFRVHVIQVAEEEHVVSFVMHHIISDGWSLAVMTREMLHWYAVELGRTSAVLPALEAQYSDYARWQQRSDMDAHLEYWRERLKNYEGKLDLPGVTADHFSELGRAERERLSIEKDLGSRLTALGHENQASLFMVLLSALVIVLYKHTGRTDLCVGTTVAGRSQLRLEPLIGFFVNILPLRIDISGDPTGTEILSRVRNVLIEALDHQDLPFEQLLAALPIDGRAGGNSLVPIMVRHQNYPEASYRAAAATLGLDVQPVVDRDRDAKCALDIQFYGDASGLEIVFEYGSKVLDGGAVRRMLEHFQEILAAMADMPGATLGSFPSASRREEALFASWNAGTRTPVAGRSVVELFEDQAGKTPGAVACVGRGHEVTFGELHQKSCQVSEYLRKTVAQGARVAVFMERSPELLMALLGILKAGCIYVPVESTYPAAYVSAILSEADPDVVLTSSDLTANAAIAGLQRASVCVFDSAQILEQPRQSISVTPAPTDIAYIAFTSGSTGRPKGVAVPHVQMLNLLHALWARSPVDADEVIAQKTPASFVVSVKELLAGLLAGARTVFLDDRTVKDATAFADALESWRVTRLNLVPSHLAALLDATAESPHKLRHLRTCTTAGEPLPAALADRFRRACPQVRLWNNYGCTELNDVTYFPVEGALTSPFVPIGFPIANTRLHVVNDRLQHVPIGVAGELCVEGDGISAGYWRQPDLTHERYVPSPFSDVPGALMFRTRDMVRFRPDGAIEYLGRKDFEVKVRGNRVNVHQVEAVLSEHAQIQAAAVHGTLRADGTNELVAYFVPRGAVSAAELRQHISERLPSFMVPTRYCELKALPKLPNGKLNRNELAAPAEASEEPQLRPADDAVEAIVREVWCKVLGRSSVGSDDDFFAIGGHSLLATQVVRHLRERLSVDIPLSDLFEFSTVSKLSQRIWQLLSTGDRADVRSMEVGEIAPDLAHRHEPFPLTDVQQAYFLGRRRVFTLGGVATHGYNEIAFEDLDLPKLTRVLNRLIQRHDMLRTVFSEDLTQTILPSVGHYDIAVDDLRGASAAAVESALQARRDQMSHQVLDPSQWPVFQVRATLISEKITHLHISTDALLMDSVSARRLAREIGRLYADESLACENLPLLFRDYVVGAGELRKGARYMRAEQYWKERLPAFAPAPELPLAVDPATVRRPSFARRARELPPARWERLQSRAAHLGVTRSALLLSAYAQVLATWAKTPRFTINLTTFNRLPLHPDVDKLMGDFASLLLLEVDASPAVPFRQRTRAIQFQLWRDMEHSAVSGVQVLRELSALRGERQTMPVVFTSTLTDTATSAGENPFVARTVYSISQTPQTWIDHQVRERDGKLVFRWDVVEELFPPGVVDAMFDAYCRLLDELIELPYDQEPACNLVPALDEQIARAANDTRAPTTARALHDLFEQVAVEQPHAQAVIGDGCVLTYGDLREQARALAAKLQEHGLRPGGSVAVVMEKGWEQVVAVLGTLYAGGVYVPLDTSLPPARLVQCLEMAEATIALVTPSFDGRVLPGAVRPVVVDRGLRGKGSSFEPVRISPDQLAYVIYTSGSTGVPKGVMIDHQGAVNTVEDVNAKFAVNRGDRILGVSALTFDLSVYDIFGSLAAGATLVLPNHRAARDPAHWLDLIARHRVTIWNSVPALASLLTEDIDRAADLASIRVFLLSGDTIPVELARRLRMVAPAAEVVSLGGATEASIWSIWYPIGTLPPEMRAIPYGKAMRNQQMFVLDDALNQRPCWVTGRIYIGGMGLAKGYKGDAEKTAHAFVTSPRGERIYRTGDLGRLLPDGNIEFLGREDSQVKIAGYRIELGEIEAILSAAPHVRAAAVKVVGRSAEDRRLVAYVTLTEEARGGSDLGEQLRAWARSRLPQYMVPTQLIFLDRMPLTANGKVDRSALPEPDSQVAADAEAEDLSSLEKQIAPIWKEILQVGSVRSSDNFFELGGNSISATQLVSRVRRELAVSISLEIPFQAPTLREFCARVELACAPTPAENLSAGGSGEVGAALPLSHSQARIWCLDRFEPEKGFYNVSGAIRLGIKVEPAILQAVFEKLASRHEVLRTVIRMGDNPVRQTVLPTLPLEVRESFLTDVPEGEFLPRAMPLLEAEARIPFKCDERLVRAHFVNINGGNEFVQLTVHHVICDGWSVRVLLGELAELYRAYVAGARVAGDEPVAYRYRDYVAWQAARMAGPELLAQRDYWRRQLAGAPYGVDVPLDHPRPTPHLCNSRVCSSSFPAEDIRLAKGVAARSGSTLFMVMLAALAVQLQRWTRTREFVVGTVVAGRTLDRTEQLVGCFINFLPLRLRVPSDHTCSGLLDSVRRTVLDAYANQDYPFMSMADDMAKGSGASRMPLFNVAFQMVNLPKTTRETSTGSGMIALNREATALDLRLVLTEERSGALKLDCGYNADIFERTTIEQFLSGYGRAFNDMIGILADESSSERAS